MATSVEGHEGAYVKEYLEKRGPDIAILHEAFRNDDQQEKAQFQEALHDYATHCATLERHSLPFDPVECTWEDVIEELRKAQDAAAKTEANDKGLLARVRAKAFTVSKILAPAIEALPDELSVLRGGLAIIFNLAQRHDKIRQDILDVFEDIPGTITEAYKRTMRYPDDVLLYQSVRRLKVALFLGIPSLIRILRPGSFVARVARPWNEYTAEEVLRWIHRETQKLNACAQNLQDGLIVDMSRATSAIETHVMEISSQIGEIPGQIRDIPSRIRTSISGASQEFQQQHEDAMKQQFARMERFMEHITDSVNSRLGMFQMLIDVVSVFQCGDQGALRSPDTDPAITLSPSSPQLEEQRLALLAILAVEWEHERRDLDNVLRQSYEFDCASKSYGAMILANKRFQEWYVAADRNLVYVEGWVEFPEFGGTSPVSYFCANLVRLVDGHNRGQHVVLHFFCGQHVASNDDLQGPRGLLRSLVAQLLYHWPPQSPMDDLGDVEALLADHRAIPTKDLCELFGNLVQKMPLGAAVYCIIDDFAQFEKDRWDEDYTLVVELLKTLVYRPTCTARFKAFLTSATWSRWLQTALPEERRIEVTVRERQMAYRSIY